MDNETGKDILKQYKEFEKEYNKDYKPSFQYSCPQCGYCPHCGRGRQLAPYWPQGTYTGDQPWQQYHTWC